MSTAEIRKVEFDDIQLIRYWRNQDHVRMQMTQTKLIDREGQRSWFKGHHETTDRRFIYSHCKKDVGMASIVGINNQERTCEGGIFCGDPSFLGHWVNIWACLQIYTHAFSELGLAASYATILSSNSKALRLNEALGYRFSEPQGDGVGRYILTKEGFEVKAGKLNHYLNNFAK